MVHFARLTAVVVGLVPLLQAKAVPHNAVITDPTDRYIVTLRPDVDMHKHMDLVHDLHTKTKAKRVNSVFSGVTHTYNISDFQAYAGHFSTNVIEQLRHHDDVDIVESDQIWKPASLTTQDNSPNSLSMISHRSCAQGRTYVYDSSAGAGTFGYIVDSGINVANTEFGGRAILGHNALPMVSNADVSGHGTHVAGVVGSTTWGVAKQCSLIGVKVFHNEEGGLLSVMLAGYEWAVADIRRRNRARLSTVLLATWGTSPAVDSAVKAAGAAGILTVVAAGNDGSSAGATAPGVRGGALVVGATDNKRVRASFSNYGGAVSLWAPGVKIASTWIGSARASNIRSGTSQAAAHVAGVALYLKGMKTADAKREMAKLASRGVVGDTRGSANLFLYNGSGK